MYKLFMILLGSKAPARNVEQHDFYFGIAREMKELIPEMKTFWPEAGDSLHIDGWREVTTVDGFRIQVKSKDETPPPSDKRLFFVNLGGYQEGRFEEQHYTMLTVQEDRMKALKTSMASQFFKESTIKTTRGANAHIDEKYGIDVDEFYRIEELLSAKQKELFSIEITATDDTLLPDELHLGYTKLNV